YALILRADLVIADISTLNPNAIYELGVRHAAKPLSTIIIKAESTSKIPFDIDHTRVFSYKHLGEDIGVDEANRMQTLLKEKMLNIAKTPVKDSPVYEYLQTLQEPQMDIEEYKDIVGALAKKNDCIFALVENAKLLMGEDKFNEAIKYWEKALEKNPKESYYIQQLALCTYKQQVNNDEQEMYLNDALRILDKLVDSNDPETFGLKGAIYKRLSKINNDNISYLDRAIENYEKGYMINYDFYTGENLAFCFDKKSALLNDGNDEKIYCRIQAKKIREQLFKILSSKIELEDIRSIPNIKWMSATFSICCYALGEVEDGKKYETIFKETAEHWEISTYESQKEELKQLLNLNFM
ncbi:tetratricopeptide repeat-containing protein, partial [Duncaniella muris]|uniref:tetratricopeptide repeat-containing protein n=2 Tax=Bacteroidales TaxID=171549 RepID=UPI0025B6486B